MRKSRYPSSRFRLDIAFGFAALGFVSCGVFFQGTPPSNLGTPTFFPSWNVRQTHTNSKSPAFSPTLFPTLSATPTRTGTPYPKDEWIGLGPEGGNVTDVMIDPITPSTPYAAKSDAGVFKSTDGGDNWRAVNAGLALNGVKQLLMDPISPETLYAVGWLDEIQQTVDGGKTWRIFNTNLPHNMIDLLAIDPTTTSTLYALTSWGKLVNSTNKGEDWYTVTESILQEGAKYEFENNLVLVHPTMPTTLFVGTDSGLYRSVDGGQHWAGTGMFGDVATMTYDPNHNETLYVGLKDEGLFGSKNGGGEWHQIQDAEFRVYDLAVNPKISNALYAVTGYPTGETYDPGANIQISSDGGRHWTKILTQSNGINSIAVDPKSPATLYTGTAYGIQKSITGGKEWSSHNNGLTAFEIPAITMDTKNPSVLYAGSFSYGLFISIDGGGQWTEKKSEGLLPIVGKIVVDPIAPSNLYLMGYYGLLYKSSNGGMSWQWISDAGYLSDVEIEPATPTILYAGTHYPYPDSPEFPKVNVIKSTDGGVTWEEIFAPPSAEWISDVVIDPATPTTIYIASDVGVFLSTDSGEGWS